MEKVILYTLKNLYRDNMDVVGYRFGDGEKSVCVIGSSRGDELQQTYICSQLIKRLKKYELEGKIEKNKSILIVPSINTYSMNIGKRFYPIDNTDINRMFPGYKYGETTQRIASGVFENIQGYEYGLQFASNYISGKYIEHVKVMKTDFSDVEKGLLFSFPYLVIRNPSPFDTTTLNYNWQIWDTKAYSLYSKYTTEINEEDAKSMIDSVLTFLSRVGVLNIHEKKHIISNVVNEENFIKIHSPKGGLFVNKVSDKVFVNKGEELAKIIDGVTGEVTSRIYSPVNGSIYYHYGSSATYQGTILFQIIPSI